MLVRLSLISCCSVRPLTCFGFKTTWGSSNLSSTRRAVVQDSIDVIELQLDSFDSDIFVRRFSQAAWDETDEWNALTTKVVKHLKS